MSVCNIALKFLFRNLNTSKVFVIRCFIVDYGGLFMLD